MLAESATPAPRPVPEPSTAQKLPINEAQLARAWESSQRVTKEDW